MHLSRRHFFFGSLALPALAAKKAAPERPNVLLLIADNVPQWVLGAYGNKEIRTPNLDRLAHMGTRFLDHYVAVAVARAEPRQPADRPRSGANRTRALETRAHAGRLHLQRRRRTAPAPRASSTPPRRASRSSPP